MGDAGDVTAERTPIPDRRRQHFSGVTRARLDERTRVIGKSGIAAARAELARNRGDTVQRRQSASGLRDPSLHPVPRARVKKPLAGQEVLDIPCASASAAGEEASGVVDEERVDHVVADAE